MTKLLRLLTKLSVMVLTLGLFVGLGTLPSSAQEQLAENDLERVQATGTIVFGTSADYPPFEYYDSNFRLDGFDIALAKELGARLGVEVAFNDFAFAGLLDALQLGAADAAIAAISVTPDRQQEVDFTNLYFVGEDAIVVRADDDSEFHSATDFADKKVGVQAGTTYHSWAQQSLVDAGVISQADLKTYVDVTSMMRDLRNSTVDVVLLGHLPAVVYTTRAQDLRIAGQGLSQQRFAIALRKGSSLTQALNDALLAIQEDGTYSKLASQYLNIDENSVAANPATVIVQNLIADPAAVAAAAKSACLNGMSYVADLNLDDHNMTAPPVMSPGQSFVKSWRVRNSGTCDWQPDYALVYVAGNRPEAIMGAQPVLVGRVVAPGETVDLSISLQAPTTYGTFQAFFQMRDDTGKLFGETIWAGIQVPNPNPPTPVPATPTPPPPSTLNPNLRADAIWINAGQCTTIRWDVDGVSAVYFVDDAGVQHGVGGHDSRTVCPTQTTTYSLRVVQTNGTTVDFPITINVSAQATPVSPSPKIDSFSVNSNAIGSGQCVNFSWSTSNASGVNLYRSNNRVMSGGPTNGSFTDCPPDGTWDYRLEAYGNGNTTQNVTVSVGGLPRDE